MTCVIVIRDGTSAFSSPRARATLNWTIKNNEFYCRSKCDKFRIEAQRRLQPFFIYSKNNSIPKPWAVMGKLQSQWLRAIGHCCHHHWRASVDSLVCLRCAHTINGIVTSHISHTQRRLDDSIESTKTFIYFIHFIWRISLLPFVIFSATLDSMSLDLQTIALQIARIQDGEDGEEGEKQKNGSPIFIVLLTVRNSKNSAP